MEAIREGIEDYEITMLQTRVAELVAQGAPDAPHRSRAGASAERARS